MCAPYVRYPFITGVLFILATDVVAAPPAATREAGFLRKGDRVVFLGDSITARAIYTGYIEDWVRALHPELEVRFFNAGKGSDTAEGGLRRLEKDVLVHSPSVVVVCYGMNDAVVRRPNAAVDPRQLETYLSSHREVIRILKARGVRPFLMTPPIARLDLTGELEGHYRRLAVFSDELRKLAAELQIPIADVYHLLRKQEPEYRKHALNGQSLVPDGVHPGEAGCMLMAMEVLEAWGLAQRPRGVSTFLKSKDRLVFLGDSITAQAYYVKFLDAWLQAFYPELEVRCFNAGKGSETAAGGLARLDDVIRAHSPTAMTILYGANDGGRLSKPDPQRLESYVNSTRSLIRRLRERNVRPYVLTQICVAEDRQPDLKGVNAAWTVFADACIKVAHDERAPLVDLFHTSLRQSAVYQAHYPDDRLIWDGVHPRGPGGAFMAVQILRAWGMAE
jgi:lysophospholipase L1-like esterase